MFHCLSDVVRGLAELDRGWLRVYCRFSRSILFSASDLLVGCEPARVTASAFLRFQRLLVGLLSAAQRRAAESLSDARDPTFRHVDRTSRAFFKTIPA